MSPDTPVTEKMCQERHSHLEKKFDDMHTDVKELVVLLKGNGKLGHFGKVNIMWGLMIFLASATSLRLLIWIASFLPKG